jgi:hypothetical protein
LAEISTVTTSSLMADTLPKIPPTVSITNCQSRKHGFSFFLALHLWANHDEVQNGKHQNQRKEAHQATCICARGWSLSKSVTNPHTKPPLMTKWKLHHF